MVTLFLTTIALASQPERVWVVAQGEIPEAAQALAGNYRPDHAKRVSENLPDWILEPLDSKTLVLRPKSLPLLDYPAREVELLEAMGEAKGKTVELRQLPGELREYVEQKLTVIGYGKLGPETTVHLDVRRRYMVDHEKGTYLSSAAEAPDLFTAAKALTPLSPEARTGGADWPVASPASGLSFHFSSSAKTSRDTLEFSRTLADWLQQRVDEAMRRKAQLAKDLYPEGLPRSFEELPERSRTTMQAEFLNSFRSLGYESRDAAERAWARRKGFRADTMWYASVAERRSDGSVILRTIGLFKVEN